MTLMKRVPPLTKEQSSWRMACAGYWRQQSNVSVVWQRRRIWSGMSVVVAVVVDVGEGRSFAEVSGTGEQTTEDGGEHSRSIGYHTEDHRYFSVHTWHGVAVELPATVVAAVDGEFPILAVADDFPWTTPDCRPYRRPSQVAVEVVAFVVAVAAAAVLVDAVVVVVVGALVAAAAAFVVVDVAVVVAAVVVVALVVRGEQSPTGALAVVAQT